MNMNKHGWLTVLTVMALALGSLRTVRAEIIPAYGQGQIGLQAVVLCEKLTVRQGPGTSNKAVNTLRYGTRIIVDQRTDGWARCFLSDALDAGPAGWVNEDYLAIDPAWYRTEEKTSVYAWNDTAAPKVALLDRDTELPVLKDAGEWLIVSLRGATGWIHLRNRAAGSSASTGQSGTVRASGRRDGERFEDVIILEGMEEKVRYEHIRNDAIGFEMDYEYESLVRRSEQSRECFVSVYDSASDPENYLEVSYSPENAETVAAAVSEALSFDYDAVPEAFTLDRAGACVRIDASAVRGGKETAEQMQAVYIIPAGSGCIVARAHYAAEASEGFGRRFRYMLNTLEVTGR